MPDIGDDIALLDRIAHGDRDALRRLFEKHAPLMLGISSGLLDDRHAAEDVVNEVFFELWQKPDRYNPSRGSPRTFLLLLTRSRSLDRLRRGSAQSAGGGRTFFPVQGEMMEPDGSAPDDVAAQGEISEILRRELAQLPEEQRGLIELSFFAGLSHQQIADSTDSPLGTIKGRLRRGMLELRSRLLKHMGDATSDGKADRSPDGMPDGKSAAKPAAKVKRPSRTDGTSHGNSHGTNDGEVQP